ncbi:hypothetical protein T439DRAFT_173014 [Meredithblackwellia eburnea MCA 4105]
MLPRESVLTRKKTQISRDPAPPAEKQRSALGLVRRTGPRPSISDALPRLPRLLIQHRSLRWAPFRETYDRRRPRSRSKWCVRVAPVHVGIDDPPSDQCCWFHRRSFQPQQ